MYRAARSGIDLNFLVKAYGSGVPIADLGTPVYHVNHIGSMRISKSLYEAEPADSPWGNLRWHSRHVVYNNPDGWGLCNAPEHESSKGVRLLVFDPYAVPPLVALRRIVLPARRTTA